mgnify:CR=1 FL=1
MRRLQCIAILLLLLPMQLAWAQEVRLFGEQIQLDQHNSQIYLAKDLPAEIPTAAVQVLAGLNPIDNFEQNPQTNYWLHVRLHNASDNKRWVFDPTDTLSEDFRVYFFDGQRTHATDGGYYSPHYYGLHYGIPITLEPQQSGELLVYITGGLFSNFPRFSLISETGYARSVLLDNSWVVGCLGAMALLALYNLLFGVWLRERSHVYYAVYLLAMVIGWAASLNALGDWLGLYSRWLLFPPFFLGTAFCALFTIHFLQLHRYHPRLTQLSYAMVAWSTLMSIVFPFFALNIYLLLMSLTSTTWLIIGLYAGLLRWRAGYKPAGFFLVAFGLLLLGVIVSLLPVLGFNVAQKDVNVATLMIQTLDIILLSLALGDRMNELRKQKTAALQQAVVLEHEKRQIEHQANLTLEDANAKLADALLLSEQEVEQKTNFLRMVNHELRTPLHTISSSIAQWDQQATAEQRELLFDDIRFGAGRLRTQIENLVLMAETDDHRLEPESYPFELAPFIEKLEQLAGERISSEKVIFKVTRGDNLPCGFQGDAHLTGHLLRTLLDNACKFTEQGEIELEIDWNDHAQTLDVTIRDTGCGMSEAQQKVVFKGFIQVSRGLTRQSEGLGLGLTLCHRLSAALDANLSIDSNPSTGTEVHLQIPLTPTPREPLPLHEPKYPGPVLIVEDNLVNAKVLERIVARLGHPVDVAHSGLEAIVAATKKRYCVILMDVQMPDMDGITATQKLRQRDITTPIVAVTANSDTQVRRQCRQAGMNDFLVKPVGPAEVQQALLEWQLVPTEATRSRELH